MQDIVYSSAHEIAAAIRRTEVSASEVVAAHLAHIRTRNPALNAIVTLEEEAASRRARLADEALARGEVWGPLHGVPLTLKDCLAVAGMRTTAGFPPLADYVPSEDATVTARLRAAGAIILGKTNVPVLASDAQTTNPLFGRTNNPWNLNRTPGGSSGGAAVDADAGSGNGGGGGGGGGQAGQGAAGGRGGGGSFGVVLLSATGVSVTDCVIQTSAGGQGGTGGAGGTGGPGGAGAAGAQRCTNEIGGGGSGANGGAGGPGGDGGGGGGGPTAGFVYDAASALNESGNTVELGPAGTAGGGPGAAGAPGVAVRSIDLSSPPAASTTAAR
jgi:hypothetical protein